MIFGTDNRTAIRATDASYSYYAPIVQIVSYFSDGYVSQGSGTIVGANDVLTAAHVLYSKEHGGYATSAEITPGRDGQQKPFGVVLATEFHASASWISLTEYDGDYGLISLSKSIGYATGWATMSELPTSSAAGVIGTLVSSYGYPGDLNTGEVIYKTTGTVDSKVGDILHFSDDLDAKPGQSGSGVFIQNSAKMEVAGVVSHESYTPNYNGVLALSANSISALQTWALANDTDQTALKNTDAALKPVVDAIDLMFYSFLGYGGDKTNSDYLIAQYQNGATRETIASIFYNSTQYKSAAAANYNNTDFLKHIFTDVLSMQYTASDFSYWLNILDKNVMSRTDIMSLCSTLTTFENKHALDSYSFWHNNYKSWALESSGNKEDDMLTASTAGDSTLYGQDGNDTLVGKSGSDYLWGGKGTDKMTGGAGADFFAWGVGDGFDTVTDFSVAEDFVRLRGDFKWSFGTSNGSLAIAADDGSGGLILTGVPSTASGLVHIIQGGLV
jgi:V8-like Glu-specific endopeptidase